MRVSLSCPSACSRRRPQAHIFVALVLTIGVGLLLAPSHALAVDSTTSPYQVVDAGGAAHLVVALDAGHGSVIGDVGAVGNGLYESNLTTVITDSFASRLEQYVGVSVVRTRPANGTYGSQSLDLVARTLTAQSAGADVFVSNHVNSGGGRGVEVWIPNASSYNYGFHTLGTNLGNLVLGNLTRLGFASRGLKSESYGGNSPESRYPDGSAADAFSVIRNSRLRGIPAILIEHGFIDNGSDAAKLGSMSTLMSMGQADADALASHYGLVSGVTIPRFYVSRMRSGEMQISWRSTQAQRYAVAIRRNEDEKWQTYTYDLTSCSYDLTSLPDGSPLIDGMTYEICVQGFKGSAWSDIDEGSRWITVAANPQNVTATPVGSGQISLSWSPVQGASKYAIAEYVDGNYVTYTMD